LRISASHRNESIVATIPDYRPILGPEQVTELVIRPLIANSIAGQVLSLVNTGAPQYRVPIVAADPSAAWVAEGQEIPASDADIDELIVTPKKLAGLSIISSELAADSSPAAQQVVGDGLVRDLVRKLDRHCSRQRPPTDPPACPASPASRSSPPVQHSPTSTLSAMHSSQPQERTPISPRGLPAPPPRAHWPR
jgi:predicted phage gp36 major capsid-like protein